MERKGFLLEVLAQRMVAEEDILLQGHHKVVLIQLVSANSNLRLFQNSRPYGCWGGGGWPYPGCGLGAPYGCSVSVHQRMLSAIISKTYVHMAAREVVLVRILAVGLGRRTVALFQFINTYPHFSRYSKAYVHMAVVEAVVGHILAAD